MIFGQVKWKERCQERFKSFAATFLVLLYFAGNVQVESFHQVFHSLDKALHSSEQEKDPCHRAIYHEVKDEGCDHKTHVTAIKKCPLCHVIPFNDQHAPAREFSYSAETPASYHIVFVASSWSDSFYNIPARAPPVS